MRPGTLLVPSTWWQIFMYFSLSGPMFYLCLPGFLDFPDLFLENLSEGTPYEVFGPWVRWDRGPGNPRFVASSRRIASSSSGPKNDQILFSPKVSKIHVPGLGTLRLAIWTTYFQFSLHFSTFLGYFFWSFFRTIFRIFALFGL